MWNLIAQSVDLVAQHPGLATLVAFAAAIIEAVAVLGILIPGTPILMAVAGAAAMAGLPMTPILVVSILGAIIGDGISFWIGHRFNGRIRGVWPFASRPQLMCSAEAFFQRYGLMSVALCRFIPVLRSTVPMIAGMAGMRRSRFLAANICSAFVWAPVHVLPAQFAGLSVDRIVEGDWQTAAMLAAGLVVFAAGGLWLHRAAKVPNKIPGWRPRR